MYKKPASTLQKIETWIAAGSLLALLLLSVFQLLLRNLLDYGYPEIDLINRHLLVLCGMMGAVLATSNISHIKIDALSTVINLTDRPVLQAVIWLFSCTVCLALTYYSAIFCLDEWEYAPANERWLLGFTLTYPICFALMSVHFFMLIWQKNPLPVAAE